MTSAPTTPDLQAERPPRSALGAASGSRLFRTVVCDPPWPMPETGKRTSGKKNGKYICGTGREIDAGWWETKTGKTVKLPYVTMTMEQIKAIEIPAEANAHLYLWTTGRYILSGEACDVVKAWGFRPAQLLTWCKTPMGLGFGGAYCNTTEFVIFCRRGVLKHQQREDSTWWKWGRPYEGGHIAHSAKPEAFGDMVMRVSPPPYLELFARRQRLGWATWGNECLNHVELNGANR